MLKVECAMLKVDDSMLKVDGTFLYPFQNAINLQFSKDTKLAMKPLFACQPVNTVSKRSCRQQYYPVARLWMIKPILKPYGNQLHQVAAAPAEALILSSSVNLGQFTR